MHEPSADLAIEHGSLRTFARPGGPLRQRGLVVEHRVPCELLPAGSGKRLRDSRLDHEDRVVAADFGPGRGGARDARGPVGLRGLRQPMVRRLDRVGQGDVHSAKLGNLRDDVHEAAELARYLERYLIERVAPGDLRNPSPALVLVEGGDGLLPQVPERVGMRSDLQNQFTDCQRRDGDCYSFTGRGIQVRGVPFGDGGIDADGLVTR